MTVIEGATAEFTVALGSSAAQSVTVEYTTVDGSAVEGSDYNAASGPLTVAPRGTQTIRVETRDDSTPEEPETFTVTLSDTNQAILASATGTINDNDGQPPPPPPPPPPPTLSIEDAAASEGEDVVFTVTLAGTRDEDVEVAYTTADGTARPPPTTTPARVRHP